MFRCGSNAGFQFDRSLHCKAEEISEVRHRRMIRYGAGSLEWSGQLPPFADFCFQLLVKRLPVFYIDGRMSRIKRGQFGGDRLGDVLSISRINVVMGISKR